MKMKNRLLALLLCAVMCLSLFPAGAFAEDGGEATEEPAAAVEVSEQLEEAEQPEEEPSEQPEETPDQPTDGSDGTPSADPAAEAPEGGPAEGPTEGVPGEAVAGEPGQEAPEDPAAGTSAAEGEETPSEGTEPADDEGEEDGSAEETEETEETVAGEEAGEAPDGEEEEEDETVTPASVPSAASELQAAIDAAKADGKTFYTLDASITIDGDVDASGITIVIPAGVTLTIGVGARLTVTDFSIQDTQNARGHIVVQTLETDDGTTLFGKLLVAGRIDLGDKFWIWDDWVRDGSFMGISYDEAVPDSGFTVECTITSAGADESTGLLRVLEAEMYMTDDHMFLSATIPSGMSIDTDAEIMVNTGVTMNVAGELNTTAIVDVSDDGVLNIAASGSVAAEGLVSDSYDKSVWTEGTVNVAGTLYARNGIVVAYRDEDGELNVTGSGKVQTDGPLCINTSGAVTLQGSASVSALTVPEGGQILMGDDSRFTLSDCDWTEQGELTRISGCFILNDNSAVECVFEAYNVEDFYGACGVSQALGNIFYPFGDHVSGRIRAHCGVDVVDDLNTASPKPIAIEIRGDSDVSDCVGSLTVAPGVTFTAGALELYAATMTVEGTLVTTDELRIEDDATYGAGKLIFKTDKCYVNEGGSLFVCDTVNPDAHIAGLTMTRFNCTDTADGRRYADTGNYPDYYDGSMLQAAIDAAIAKEETEFTVGKDAIIDENVDASGIKLIIPAGVTLTVKANAVLSVTDLSFQKNSQGDKGCIVAEADSKLLVKGRIDLSDTAWVLDDWFENDSMPWIFFDDGVAGGSGLIVHRKVTTLDDGDTGLIAALNTALYMSDYPDHIDYSMLIPAGTSIDTGDIHVDISGTVTLEVAGNLSTVVLRILDEASLNVTGSGKVFVDNNLVIYDDGKVTLSGQSSVSADSVDTNYDPDDPAEPRIWTSGRIVMKDDSSFTMHGGYWTEIEKNALESGFFVAGDNSIIVPYIEVMQLDVASPFLSSFADALSVCHAFGSSLCSNLDGHISGRVRICEAVTVGSDLDVTSPKAVPIEIRRDSGFPNHEGSLTVETGATFTADFLDLNGSAMTVNGTLISTAEVLLRGDDTSGIGSLAFAADECYVNQGGYLLVSGAEDPDAQISGLTMTRFETTDQTEGRRYVDTGNYSSDYEDSTALLAAIAGGTDFTVGKNTIIQDGETVDASGIKISVAAGVTLLVKGKLTVGDFEIETDAQGLKGCIRVPAGGKLHMTKQVEIDHAVWTVWEQDGSAKRITFADGAGLIVDLGDCVTMTSLTAALDDAAQALTNSGTNRAHLRFELGIPAGTDIDTGSTAITIPSGITLNIDTGAALTVGENGLTVAAGGIVVNRGSLISSGTVTVAVGGVFTLEDSPEEGFAANVTLGAGGEFLVSGTLNPDGSSTVFLAYAESIAAAMATVSGVPVGILNIDAGADTAAGFTALWTEALNYPDVGTLNLCLEGIDITFGTDIGVDVPSNVCLVVNEGSSLTVPETDPATEVNLNGAIAMEGGSFVNNGTLNVRGFVNFQRSSSKFVNNGILNVYGGIGVHSMHGDTTATLTDNGTLNILEGGYIEPAVTVIGSHVHRYTLSGWIWTDISEEEEISGKTGYRAEAAFICKNCPDIEKPNATKILTAEVTETDSDGVTVYTATVRGPDGKTYSDSKVIGFVISGLEDTYYYTGSAIRPVITVTYKGRLLAEKTDFSVSYKNNTKVGTATVTVKGKGNYISDSKNYVTKTFEIIPPPQTASDPTAVLVDYDTFRKAKIAPIPAETFHNCFFTPEPVVTVNGEPLSKDNYTVSYSNNWNKGSGTVAVTNFGDKQKTIKKTFKINPYNLEDGYRNGEITVDQIPDTSIIKKGTKPKPVVKFGDAVLLEGRDYKLNYKNNKKDGTGTIKIDGKGNYKGRIEIEYKILKTDLGSGQIIMTVADCAAGTKMSKAMGIVNLLDLDSGMLGKKDYTLEFTYEDGTVVNKSDKPSAGTRIIVTATGQGMYTGTLVSSFRVVEGSAKDISKAKVTFRKDIEYTGSPVILGEGDFTITMKGQPTPELGKDFIITGYTNNVNKGTAHVVFRGIGDYCGTKTYKFKITASKITP